MHRHTNIHLRGGDYVMELHIHTSGEQIREYYVTRACGMHQRSEHVILMGKAERKKQTVSWTNVRTEVYQNGS